MRLSNVIERVWPSLSATSMLFGPVRVPQPSISSILFFFMRKWTPLTMPADTCRERLCVGPYAVVASPSMPYLAFSWVSRWASSAFLISALLGMQPTLVQVPPSAGPPLAFFQSSMQATFIPSCAARMAAM